MVLGINPNFGLFLFRKQFGEVNKFNLSENAKI